MIDVCRAASQRRFIYDYLCSRTTATHMCESQCPRFRSRPGGPAGPDERMQRWYHQCPRVVVLGFLVLLVGALGCTQERPVSENPFRGVNEQVFAKGGAWTWFNDERAVVADSVLYVGHVDTAGYSSVTTYSMGSDAGPTRHRLSSFRQQDDHNNPALLPREDGSIFAAYARHHEDPYWFWRTVGTGSSAWTPERRTDSIGAPVTYNNVFRLSAENGRLYNFFRGHNFDPTLMRSSDRGASWDGARHFLRAGDQYQRPYAKYVTNGTDRIDVLYTQGHPRHVKNDVYHLYYRDGALHKSDGTQICRLEAADCLPVDYDEGTRVYAAHQAGRAWVWDVEYAENGVPVAAYVTARDSTVGRDLRYRYARFAPTEKRWTENEIAHAGTRLYEGENHYAGGIAISSSDARVVYLSTDVDPKTGDARQTGRYQLYRGVESGRRDSWQWTRVTDETGADNVRPYVTTGVGKRPVLLWMQGTYQTYTDYETDIVGLIGAPPS